MAKMYKINIGQKTAIDKTSFARGEFFHPVQDINGNWFISEVEMNSVVKNNEWKNTMETEYVPPVSPII